ncbi:hypothetical protein CTA2_2740 [Colletotrichum tanaceti]|uniref:Cell wall protein n=1 Tax=Colletotrichum tanaceti TaxID=1306861 RepID=A0A4U6X9I2_9PEZI|nr:hypothetical protein CTA2_2740 [Colletotrichum tanaceti]TKW51709.1 hypothetical protein CTA1_8865 [Colletotrichum tanaceti]
MRGPAFAFGLLGPTVLIAAVPLKPRPVTIESRDGLDDIETALAPVFGSLQSVDAAVLALDGTPNAAANLLGASEQIQVTINQATLTVRASRDLSAAKSLRLRRTTDDLAAQTEATVNDLVARKPILDQLGVSTVALQSLQKQQIASMSLSEALAAKVPRVGQKEAAEDMASLQSVFTRAIAAYSVPGAVPVPVVAVPPPVAPVPVVAVPPPVAPVPVVAVPPPVAPVPVVAVPPPVAPVPVVAVPPPVAPVPVVAVPPPVAPVPVVAVPPPVAPVPAPVAMIAAPAGRKDRKKKKNKANANKLDANVLVEGLMTEIGA